VQLKMPKTPEECKLILSDYLCSSRIHTCHVWCLLFLSIFFFAMPKVMAADIQYTLFLTNDLQEMTPLEAFDCRDKIYCYITWKYIDKGAHTLSAIWFNPKGERQEYSEHKFYVSEKAEGLSTWLWLKLHGGGMLSKSIDPRSGFKDFIGKWHVKLYLDDKYLMVKYFIILC